jgi:hypothetical protein
MNYVPAYFRKDLKISALILCYLGIYFARNISKLLFESIFFHFLPANARSTGNVCFLSVIVWKLIVTSSEFGISVLLAIF